MALKTYGPGSELLPTDLNDIQDEYIDGVLTPWITIGSSVGTFYQSPTARASRGNITPANVQPGLQVNATANDLLAATYLDPADYPSSYNGSLRTLQLRLVALIYTSGYPMGNIAASIALRLVSHSSTANNFTLGAAIATITPGAITETNAMLRYATNPFNFPAAGLYTIEYSYGVVAGGDAKAAGSAVGIIQRRAI